MAVVPAIRSLVTSIDPNLPVSNVRTLEEVVTASVATRRVTMLLLVTFAGVALILALAGVYGVLAYSVARRTSEIGVRIALGAQHRRVLRLVLAQGMRPVIVGVAVGLAATFWLSRLMASLLFEIEPHDPADLRDRRRRPDRGGDAGLLPPRAPGPQDRSGDRAENRVERNTELKQDRSQQEVRRSGDKTSRRTRAARSARSGELVMQQSDRACLHPHSLTYNAGRAIFGRRSSAAASLLIS